MNQKGFSIIELILVVVIVGFIILLVTNLPSSISLVGLGRQTSLAKEIGSKQIESIRTIPFENLANGPQPVSDSRLSLLPQGLGTITIIDCPIAVCPNPGDPLFNSIKQVKVQISWKHGQESKSIEIITLISKNGLR